MHRLAGAVAASLVVSSLAACSSSAEPPPVSPAPTPAVVVAPAEAITTATATLVGSVDPAGSEAEGWFEWGEDAGLAAPTRTARVALGGGTGPVPLSAALSGLTPGTTYWFRAAGSNAGGVTAGEVLSFRTLAPAPEVTTLAADPVGVEAATLRGDADPAGFATAAWFEWGTDPALADAAATNPVALGSGAGPTPVSVAVDGLLPGTTYWYRAVAASEGGTAFGEVRSFATGFHAPAVATLLPEGLSAGAWTLRAAVDPSGLATEAWFEWGMDPALASATATEPTALAAGHGAVPLVLPLADLAPATTYYYRAVASSASGTTVGEVEWFGTDTLDPYHLVVNSLADVAVPPPGKLTLRAALSRVPSYGTISFAPGLDGGTVALSTVGEAHSVLKAEVYAFDPETRTWVDQGFQDRDFGPSALYAAKHVVIDASPLPRGITLAWAGGAASPARVLAVYGDLTLRGVTIAGGHSVAAPRDDPAQPFTLARGGGLAVWGKARLSRCVVHGNRVTGDATPSRDRGAFGGGIYVDALVLEDSIVSGNAAEGFGAAGGGIYSVGGLYPWSSPISELSRCSVTGNRVTGQHAYGGGIFSHGGGVSWGELDVAGCTIARNLVEDHPGIADDARFQYYSRGGGVYASNGTIRLTGSTVVENAVTGNPATFSERPNLGGGGIAATIGDAHIVEAMELQQSILAGNTLNGAENDVYTGSLIDFFSWGYNLVGRLDFSRMLVPIPEWACLSRKHWPKEADREGVTLAQAVGVEGVRRAASIASAGTDAGEPAVLWYEPGPAALEQVPPAAWDVTVIWPGYEEFGVETDDFLNHFLADLRGRHPELGEDFGASFGDLTGVTYHGPSVTWPSNPENAAWIAFWRELDLLLGDRLGQAGLGDDYWAGFPMGEVGQQWLYLYPWPPVAIWPTAQDQLGNPRGAGVGAAVGAIAGGEPSDFWARAAGIP